MSSGSSANARRFVLVERQDQLVAAAADLEGGESGGPRPLFIDTEFESNRGGTRLCLIQVTTGERIYLIDPLRVPDLSHLGEVLSAPGASWVLHAGMQDVKLLCETLRIDLPQHLFDTQIAWALLGPEASVSLAYVQYKVCGVRSGKGHQADDWMRRPLPESQLDYAAADVDYLPQVHAQLRAKAERLGRVEVIELASRDALNPEREPPAPLRPADFRNAWQLDAAGQAALDFLVGWYNGLPARERANAPETKTLLALAARMPPSVDALGRIKGVSGSLLKQHGRSLVEGIQKAVTTASGADFQPAEPPSYATYEEIRLEAWLTTLRAQLCERLEVAPELVLPGRLQKRMIAACLVEGTSGLLGSLVGWRQLLLGAALQEYCAKFPPPLDAPRQG